MDRGVVETIAHYTAAKHFCPQVDFILDIGGQDIKCFKIKNGAIDSIMAQRGLLLRVRVLHRDLRPVHGLRRRRLRGEGAPRRGLR